MELRFCGKADGFYTTRDGFSTRTVTNFVLKPRWMCRFRWGAARRNCDGPPPRIHIQMDVDYVLRRHMLQHLFLDQVRANCRGCCSCGARSLHFLFSESSFPIFRIFSTYTENLHFSIFEESSFLTRPQGWQMPSRSSAFISDAAKSSFFSRRIFIFYHEKLQFLSRDLQFLSRDLFFDVKLTFSKRPLERLRVIQNSSF